jgi:hypothetical protein
MSSVAQLFRWTPPRVFHLASRVLAFLRYSTESTSLPLPNIHEMAGDRRRRRHGGRDEMGAVLKTLAALEVAVRGRGAALAGQKLVRVHREAHRTAGLAPHAAAR